MDVWSGKNSKSNAMRNIQVYIHSCRKGGKDVIDCMCLASNKGCEYDCGVEIVKYDPYQGIDECFANKGKKDYEQLHRSV